MSSINKRKLQNYLITASSLLTTVGANADVQYSEITSADSLLRATPGAPDYFNVDLNHDGSPDLRIGVHRNYYSCYGHPVRQAMLEWGTEGFIMIPVAG